MPTAKDRNDQKIKDYFLKKGAEPQPQEKDSKLSPIAQATKEFLMEKLRKEQAK